MEALEYVARDVQRRAARGAGAQQDGQQFRIRQGRGAFLEQLLARSFSGGPIPDRHDRQDRAARRLGATRISSGKREV